MNAKRWIALLLALTLAASMLAGCTKKTETPPQSEQGQTEQENTPPDDPKEPDTPQEPEKEEEPQPEDETPVEPQPEEIPEEELTPEQKRLRMIQSRVGSSTIWARDEAYNNTLTEETVRSNLVRFLFDNWDSFEPAVSSYLEAEDGRVNLYQNSLEEYVCVLSHTDTLDELSIRVDKNGAEAINPAAAAVDPPKISAEVSSLVNGAKFDKRYDGYYFDDKMDAEKNKLFRAYAGQALNAFQQTIEKHRDDWKLVLDDAFQTTVSFDENDQFVFELQGKTTYWLELRYRPECGLWSDVSLVPVQGDGLDEWNLDAGKITDGYLLSLVTPLEIGMTAAPFTFERPKDLTQQQLWLMYLILTPKAELEAAYEKQDGMYHVTQKQMEQTLIGYLEYFRFDITKNPGYDEKSGEIVVPMVSGFGGDRRYQLREKQFDGNTVTFTVDYYAADDVNYETVEVSKTYTITFLYGRYRYDSVLENPAE